MNEEVTRIIKAAEAGEPGASEELLPVVYEELRRLAARRMANERPGQTLQPTALVHEAYLHLVNPDNTAVEWNGRSHFFGAAARAMRRILVDKARNRDSLKRGGNLARVELQDDDIVELGDPELILAVNEALEKFREVHAEKARLVELRFFAGLTIPETAKTMGISEATAQRHWAFARAWLGREMQDGG